MACVKWLGNSDCPGWHCPCGDVCLNVSVHECQTVNNSAVRLMGACLRLIGLLAHVLGAFIAAGVFPVMSLSAQQRFLQWWSCGLLKCLKVHHQHCGVPVPAGDVAALLVANHVSWLDIFAINVVTPACFVAKSEVRSWPVVGWLVRRSGALFIRRAVRSDTVRVNTLVGAKLQQGRAVALFPQGTSTRSGQPVQFHAPMLQSAIATGARVQPIALYYHDQNGCSHESAAYVDDMSFVQSLWKIACTPDLQVTVSYLPSVDTAGLDRRAVAAVAQQVVNEALARQLKSGHSLADQRHQNAIKAP